MSGICLLDLPAEIRLRIYEFAIPEEIILQTWDYDVDVSERIYSVQLAERDRPKFIFANKLIRQEASPIFWERVTMDHSFLSANGRIAIDTSDAGADDVSLPAIRISADNLASVRKLIISTQAEGISERIWPCAFPNLRTIDITYLPADVLDRDLQRIYVRARASKQPKSLTAILGEYFRQLLVSQDLSDAIAMDLSAIVDENKYNLSISLLPIKVYQQWSVDLWSGMMDEFRHNATALLKFDCNADEMLCNFIDVTTDKIQFQDNVLPDNVIQAYEAGPEQVRQLYRMPGELVRVKNMDLLERLICREIEDQGMIPALSAARRPAGHL